MAITEGFINVTEGSGKKAHTSQRTIGANDVQDEFTLPGEFPYATYRVGTGNVAIATANAHLLQIMAGASLNVRIRRIRIYQTGSATASGLHAVQLWRLSTAGTGGTAFTPAKYVTTDAASGATAMTLPSAKGTESVMFDSFAVGIVIAASAGPPNTLVWEDEEMWNRPPLVIPAGTANGIAIKNIGTSAAGGLGISVDFVETNFV